MNSKRTLIPILVLFSALILCPASVQAWPVPDTGQTKCYNGTVEIPCPSPGQSFHGQDGNYSINPRSFTKLDSNGNPLADGAGSWVMVRDNVIGLVWEVKRNKDGVEHYDDPGDADNTYTWYDPSDPYPGTPGNGTDTKDFIDDLNATHFGGYSDWRMPNRKELRSIVDSSIPQPGPTINSMYFPNTQASYYWSSTTDANHTYYAWIMYFNYGIDNRSNKYNSHYVRAVRGGQ